MTNLKELIQPQILTGLLLTSLLLRLPFFFRDVIDWDESTFILMGQSVLDQHLPYTTIADVKPPLVFWGYGALMALFGNSIWAIRCAGMLIVWLIGVITAWICPALGMNRNQSAIAGALTILFLSFLWSGPATMTEHLAVLPLVFALWLWLKQPESTGIYGILGMLMAAASLIRGNLIYTVAALGAYLLFSQWCRGWTALARLVAYGLGVIGTIAATSLPYLWTGKFPLWWTYVVMTPLKYSQSRSAELMQALKVLHPGLLALGVLMGILLHFGIGSVIVQQWQIAKTSSSRHAIALLGISFLATEISILRTGMGEFHYLLQLAPWFAIALVSLGQYLKLKSRYGVYVLTGLCVISFNLPIRTLIQEYRIVCDRGLAQQSLFHGSAYEIADWFKALPTAPQRPYMMVDQIVYHLLAVDPPGALVVHPSNITKAFLVDVMLGEGHTPEAEFSLLLSQHPDFIVKTESLWYLPTQSKLSQMLETVLQSDYQLIQELQGRRIYQYQGPVSEQ